MDEHREVLYSPDIARLRGISGRAARAWLASLEGQPKSPVRRVGSRLCISRRAFDLLMPGAAGTSPVSTAGQLEQFNGQLEAMGRAVMETRELAEDSAEGVQTARRAIHELREMIRSLTEKIDGRRLPVKSSA